MSDESFWIALPLCVIYFWFICLFLPGPRGTFQLPQLWQLEALHQEARSSQRGRGPEGKDTQHLVECVWGVKQHKAAPSSVLKPTNTHTHTLLPPVTSCNSEVAVVQIRCVVAFYTTCWLTCWLLYITITCVWFIPVRPALALLSSSFLPGHLLDGCSSVCCSGAQTDQKVSLTHSYDKRHFIGNR